MHANNHLIKEIKSAYFDKPSIANQLSAAATTNGNGAINEVCSYKEKQALLQFKDSLEDSSNGLLSTWRPKDDDCCKWNGVTCNNQTRHVTKLHLALAGLRGDISHSLLNLSYLNHLDLSLNSFDGTFPNFIGSMTHLRYLDLSSNIFDGTIPKFIGSMTHLRYLDLSDNLFDGTIPKFIGSMTQLRYLNLRYNSFNGTIPAEFGNLTNLRNLSFGNSERLSTIQTLDWLSNLSQLKDLRMDTISLAKANHWVDVILSLRKLSYLSLSRCELLEVMHPYSSFVNSSSSSSIQFLDLSGNNLNSSMYRWLFLLTSNRLLSLHLSGNMLDMIPNYLGNLCSLTSLYFSSNSAGVNFIDFLNNLSGCTSVTLRDLYAWSSQLTGSLPDEIQEFSSLEYLDLSHNHLNGTMSEKVWELPNLQALDVSSNPLVITPNIGKSKVSYVDLSNNSLVGPLFPKWIQTHKNLTHLDISNNRISGTIPVEFWKTWPSQLTYLNLSCNNFSGKIPDLSSNFDYNSKIDLSSNSFYGPIPNVPSTLELLNLSGNKFYGGISFLCQIVDGLLSVLDLSHNFLTGPIPDCLWHFRELKVLNLRYNKLSGRLPASIGYLIQLEVLDLYNNSFSGELPLALKNCRGLRFLNMGVNRFFGNVPVWIGENLTNLYALILRSNNFLGPIPLQLWDLMNLQILVLSINNLNGTIPSCVNRLYAMFDGVLLSQQNIHHPLTDNPNATTSDFIFEYVDKAMIEWQGNEREFTNNLGLLMTIDLSSNNLTGKIPN